MEMDFGLRSHPLRAMEGQEDETKHITSGQDGAQKAGRTLLINPGSEYSEGILKGVIIILDKKKVKDYVFTSG